jgi:hypothetical protein
MKKIVFIAALCVVADFIASCRNFGIKPGIYASTGANARLMVSKN